MAQLENLKSDFLTLEHPQVMEIILAVRKSRSIPKKVQAPRVAKAVKRTRTMKKVSKVMTPETAARLLELLGEEV